MNRLRTDRAAVQLSHIVLAWNGLFGKFLVVRFGQEEDKHDADEEQ